MKAYIAQNWPAYGYDIYLYYETHAGRTPLLFEKGEFKRSDKQYDVGEDLPRTLFLPVEIYTTLRQAMIGEAIDNDDALKDTRMIRDRLLAMIEAEWKSRQIEKQL